MALLAWNLDTGAKWVRGCRNKGACSTHVTRSSFYSFLFHPRGNLVREKSRPSPSPPLMAVPVFSSLRKRTSLVTSYRSRWNDVDYERTEVGRGFQWEIDDREDGEWRNFGRNGSIGRLLTVK